MVEGALKEPKIYLGGRIKKENKKIKRERLVHPPKNLYETKRR